MELLRKVTMRDKYLELRFKRLDVFFREKLCFDVFGSKGVQNVSDFLHAVLTTCSLKTDLNCLLGKSLVLRYLGQRDKNQIKFLR